jgi:hypothetical protein
MNAAVATVAPSGVLRALDETLRGLIQRELANVGLGPVEVTFDAPERERTATWPSPAVNLFLYDLREPALPRDRSWHAATGDGGGVYMDRGAVRVECSFAITAWTQAVIDEHHLLSQVLSILLAYPELAPEMLPPELRAGDPPVALPARIAHGREEGRSDFWSAIGSPYKVSLEYAVTVFFVPGLRRARGPLVGSTSVGGPGPSFGDPRGAGGERDPVRAVGGRVLTPQGDPAADAWVLVLLADPARAAEGLPDLGRSAVTGQDGRFSIRGLPDGEHTIRARGADGSVARAEIEVPGPPVTLELAAG